MLAIFTAINDVINKTSGEVVDSHILPKFAEIVNTFVKASFDGAESVFSQVRDMTKPAPAAPPPGP
jgi:hypothetical protein